MKDIFICCYCHQPICLSDDSQWVEKGQPAHTACAFAQADLDLAASEEADDGHSQ